MSGLNGLWPWIFRGLGFAIFAVLAAEIVRERYRHRLEIVAFPERGEPYVHDKVLNTGETLRIHRVGVRNSGETVHGIKVKPIAFSPPEPGAAYIGHELAPMGQPGGTMTMDVNKATEPLVFFDVIGQVFRQNMPSHGLHLRHAAQGLFGRSLPGQRDSYRITLAIDGKRAGQSVDFLIEKDKLGERWELKQA